MSVQDAPAREHALIRPRPPANRSLDRGGRATSGLRPGEHHGTGFECPACAEVFCGLNAFDAHRVGKHGLDEGRNRRRCLTPSEMAARGLSKCRLGRWSAVSGVTTSARKGAAA